MEAFQDYAAPGRLAVSELMDATIVSCNHSKAAVDSALCSNAARQVAIACKPRSTLVAFFADERFAGLTSPDGLAYLAPQVPSFEGFAKRVHP